MKNFTSSAFSIFFFSLFTLTTQHTFAQTTFEKMYGGSNYEMGNALAATTDGGFIITGQTMSFGDTDGDIYVVKVSANGDTEWENHYGGTNLDGGNWILQSSDGGYLIIGHTESWGLGDCEAYILKISNTGDSLWLRTIGDTGDDAAYCGINSSDNTYVISGIFEDMSTLRSNAFLAKYDFDGTLLWMKKYGTGGNESGKSMIQTMDGGYAVAGYTPDKLNPELRDGFLAKTDEDGNELWEKSFGSDSSELFMDIIGTADGGFLLSGTRSGSITETKNIYLVKTNSSGNQEWSNYLKQNGNYDSKGICIAADGNYVISGTTMIDTDTLGNILLMKVSTTGELLWEKYFGENAMDIGRDVISVANGGFAITGVLTQNENADAVLIRTNDEGDVTGINTQVNNNSVQIFPNPASNNLVIKFSVTQNSLYKITVNEVTGREIKTIDNIASDQLSIDCSNWHNGIYFINVADAENNVLGVSKFVKQ